jgi:hypothetical protein
MGKEIGITWRFDMEEFLRPTVVFPVSVVVLSLGIVALNIFHKMREKELQYHQDLRIREMEHQLKMKQLELELEKAKARSSTGQAA